MKMKLFFALFMMVSLAAATGNASTSTNTKNEVETELLKTILANEKKAVKFLTKVVNINSGTMNFEGVRKVADLFAEKFDELGFKTQWVSAEKYNRAGHLVASHGSKGPKILMIGHLDTVFATHDEFQSATMISESKIKAPGITDMKGGNVIIVEVLRALKQANLLNKFQIKVILMGDEENRGSPIAEAAKILTDAGVWADVALGFEDGDGDPKTAVISRRGSSEWHLKTYGNAAHSSQIFQENVGYGAIYEAARILNSFRTELTSEKILTYNPGLIIGGTSAKFTSKSSDGVAFGKNNVVAKVTEVSGDIRAISPQQLKRSWHKMAQIAANNLQGTHAELVLDERYPPMSASVGNRKLLALYSAVSVDYGFGNVIAVNPRNAGAADISFVAADVDMALDGLGLMGKAGHTVNETADMETFTQQSIKVAVLMHRLLTIYQ